MPKNITIFTRQTCAPCKMLKTYLQRKGIAYSEVSVDDTPEAQEKVLKLSGYNMVPFTIVTKQDNTEEYVSGFNLPRLTSILSI